MPTASEALLIPAPDISRRSATLLTPEDVAGILHVSPAWVRDHATRKQPRLPALKVRKLLRFHPEAIEHWIQAQSKGMA